ncbi:hypothetical protein N7454_008777 [Penicillium verhagenii]|nr:hypothetical protein N7454_008777 [Penicillium verhagenii]
MAAREFSLSFEAAPPASVRPSQPINLAVSVRPVGTPSPSVHALVLNASLRNEASTSAAAGLTGNLTTSIATSGSARFTSLAISTPGKYRLRVMLATASPNGIVTKEFVDSGIITVAP